MNATLKSLLFWLAIVVAALGIYQYSATNTPPRTTASTPSTELAGSWHVARRPDQPCAIFQQGDVLLIVNERGDVATARLDGAGRLTVLRGEGWQSGLTAEMGDAGKSLKWRDGSIWTRPEPRR
jgi:hypothetical protein